MEFLKSSHLLKVCFVYPQVRKGGFHLDRINGDFVLCPILCPPEVGINGLIRHNGINGLYGKALKTVK